MGSSKRFNRYFSRRRLWLIAIGILVLAFLIVFIVGQFTPAPKAWILKQAIDSWSFTAPPDFEAIEKRVAAEENIVYDGQDTLLDIYYPRDARELMPVIMWIHGGGFIGASKEQTKVYAMTLASRGYVVANINYDLAPGKKYPVPVIQSNQAVAYLQENVRQYGGDMNRFFLASNSSGSQIASQLAALISDRRFADQMGIQPAIARQELKGVLLYDGPYNIQALKAEPPPGMDVYLWSYTGRRDYESFERIDELSTAKHVTPEYPPVFLTVGDADPLEPQSLELMEVLKKNGVEVDAVLFTNTGAGLGHDYMMDLDTEAARQTLDRAVDFLERHS